MDQARNVSGNAGRSVRGAVCLVLLGACPAAAAAAVELRAELISAALSNPLDVAAPPGDLARLFVVEQRGTIRIIDLSNNAVQPVASAFLDIQTRLSSGGEKGLLGLAFHPRFAENGYFYINSTRAVGETCSESPPPGCTEDRNAETVISRFQVSASDPDHADPDSEVVLLRFCQPYSNHNGGQVAFGPLDGYLYIFTGDGGNGGDPCGSGQEGDTFLGKVLRIDVDAGDPYAIPESNPFAALDDGIRDEIWALGVRNPWRCAFDPSNGDLYIADVGQGAWEEIDYRPGDDAGGENYEWNAREGNHVYSSGTTFGPGVQVGPFLEYPHNGGTFHGCSITGGRVYRGSRMPDLQGTYFFADYCDNWVRSLRYSGGAITELTDRTAELNLGIAPDVLDDLTSFGVDGAGEMYICDFGSKLFRIVPAGPPPPRLLRGDANRDGALDISDPISIIFYLFASGTAECGDVLDANDDSQVDLSDPIHLLAWLFTNGPAPARPYPTCGPDPTPDQLPCPAGTCS